MVDLVRDVALQIIEQKQAEAIDSDIFTDFIPDTPDNIIVVSEYAGTNAVPYAGASVRSIQIISRAKTPSVARAKIWALFNMFVENAPICTIGEHTCVLALRNTPFKMEVDNKNRHLYVFNMGITISYK